MLKQMLLWFIAAFFSVSASANEIVATYQYGRFKVEVYTEGNQRVVGGEFTPPAKLPISSVAAHVVLIDYTTKELLYYRKLPSSEYEPVIGYAVVAPARESLPQDVVRGRVRQVVEKPTWCPKVGGQIRKDWPGLRAGCLPYGDAQNPMGDWRFDIAWESKGWELIRLHGTTGYPRGNFWAEDTYGCTRLENRAIKNLIDLLGPQAVKEGIEIVLWRSPLTLSGE